MGGRILSTLTRILSSYGLGVVLLLFLLVLTYLGTIDQVDIGLHAAVEKYFHSNFVEFELPGGIPFYLPGAYLVLVLFFINLLFGGIVRARWTWSRAGVLIAHLGIFVLLVGSFISLRAKVEGNLTLYEKMQSDEFQSHQEWEIAIFRAPEIAMGKETEEGREFLIPESEFQTATDGAKRVFRGESIPFTLTVSRFLLNCVWDTPQRAAPTNPVIDGVFLRSTPPELSAELNRRGVYVNVRTEDGVESESFLWGGRSLPLFVKADGKRWGMELRKARYRLPFTIRLDKFHHERHPGMAMAKAFKSDVTKFEDGQERQILIEMNQPLRHQGFTLFQSGWGPEDAKPGDKLYSSFSVVTNPADDWPLYACIIISIGLLLHFGRVLFRYLAREMEKRA
jgi:hypothetical protein